MKSRLLLTGVVLLAAFLLTSVYTYKRRSTAEPWWSCQSSDGRFQIEVLRFPMEFSVPGGSGDAPGLVRLVDRRARHDLQETRIAMVQLVDMSSVEWTSTNVSIRLIADWNLPK